MEQKNVRPITPDEAVSQKVALPSFVISAINKLLAEEFNHKKDIISIYQKDIINAIIGEAELVGEHITKDEIYDKKYLDFEETYEEYGWNVVYDSPAYCESYEPYFKFSAKKQ
jgi:hypothetical protein